jgi:hypothetical protein
MLANANGKHWMRMTVVWCMLLVALLAKVLVRHGATGGRATPMGIVDSAGSEVVQNSCGSNAKPE